MRSSLPVAVVDQPGVGQPALHAERCKDAEVAENRADRRALAEVVWELERHRADQVVRAVVIGPLRRLRRRRPIALPRDLTRERVQVGERIGARVLRHLEGVGDGRAEVLTRAPVEFRVDAARVAEVAVRQDVDAADLRGIARIRVRQDAGGEVGHLVLVVRRHVQHEILAERMAHPELK